MVERQDIDALLIGSLYGELSSTEEARLAAHLESHPADRTALADLSHARDVVRQSRILQVQFDPPQQISALLMQEAARRAPKSRDGESWFQRFMRSFIAHPAMAAAAMLVLIIGVAGTVYMRQGDHYAKQTADDVSRQETNQAPAAAAPATTEAESSKNGFGVAQGADKDTSEGRAADRTGVAATGSAASDNFKVTMDESAGKKQDVVIDGERANNERLRNQPTVAEKKKAPKDVAFLEQQKLAKEAKEDSVASADPKPKASPPAKTAAKPTRPLEVSTPSTAPKDFDSATTVTGRLDDAKRGETKREAPTGSTTVAGTGAGGASAPRTPQPGNAPPPPPPAPPTEKPADKPVDPLIAWAKQEHAKVTAAVRAGNCQNAANIAVQISNRAPAYYASNVETDRTLKQCMQYITAQREKEAERTQRAKSTQRRAVDEAPAPAPAQTTK